MNLLCKLYGTQLNVLQFTLLLSRLNAGIRAFWETIFSIFLPVCAPAFSIGRFRPSCAHPFASFQPAFAEERLQKAFFLKEYPAAVTVSRVDALQDGRRGQKNLTTTTRLHRL